MGNLHHYWDVEFVDQLDPDSKTIASDLIARISNNQQRWQFGRAADWAQETFAIAKDDEYGQLPEPNAHGSFQLSDHCLTTAKNDVAIQLSKGGVRLAMILNQALRKP
jgi:S1/P1 Nuclease